jgi:hypothetical protein
MCTLGNSSVSCTRLLEQFQPYLVNIVAFTDVYLISCTLHLTIVLSVQ